MAQTPFYRAESFDMASAAVTYTAAGLGAAKYTAGKMYYTRLDTGAPGASLNGFVSALWSPGSGTAGTVYFGLYLATGTAAAGTLFQLGVTANQGATAAGLIRKTLGTLTNASPGGANVGEYLGNPLGVLYGALLVATDSGTNHIDVGSSTAFAANQAVGEAVADPTGTGMFPRTCVGAGTSLTVMPVSEAMSGVSTSTALLPWMAVD